MIDMATPKFRIGDRFEYLRLNTTIYEIVGISYKQNHDNMPYYDLLNISDNSICSKIGEWTISDTTVLVYLGNFAKSNNFNELYDILNS